MSRWEDLDPEERARLMAIIEAEDPRPDERETFERILARFDVAYARDDPRYWPAAAFILARHAFPEEFSETRGRGAEQVWDEPRLLRLAATALVIRLRHPDWRNLTICRHLVDPANGYARLWPSASPPTEGSADNRLREAERLPLVCKVSRGEMDQRQFVALYAIEPRSIIRDI